MKWKLALAGAVLAAALTPAPAGADSIGEVENARAKERQGRWLNRQDREHVRRWGGNDDSGPYGYEPRERSYYGYDHGPVRYYRAYPY